MIRPFELKTNICSELFSFQGLIVSYLYKGFGGAKENQCSSLHCIFSNFAQGQMQSKSGGCILYLLFISQSFVFVHEVSLVIVFQYCGKQDFEFCFLSIFFISFFRISHLILGKSQSYKMWKMVWTTTEVQHTLPLNNTVITYSKKYFQLYPTRCQFKIH